MTLIEQRNAAKKELLTLLSWVNQAGDKAQLYAAQEAEARLVAQYEEFCRVHKDILDSMDDNEAVDQQLEFDITLKEYNAGREAFAQLIRRLKSIASTSQDQNTPPGPPHNGSTSGADWSLNKVTGNRLENVARKAARVIQRIHDHLSEATAEDASIIIETLSTYWTTYMNAVFEDCEAEVDEEYGVVESVYTHSKKHLHAIMKSANEGTRPTSTITTGAQHNADIKLPRIDIPKFAGHYNTWTGFHDLFTSLVHNAPNLTNVQKMHYLRSSVEGEAERQIRSFKVTDANYVEAWAALQSRYHNKRLIINSHLEQFIDMPKSQNESPTSLRRQLDTFTEAVRALAALDMPTDHWDALLVFHLVNKVDPETKRAWEMKLEDNETPTFKQLSSFIERRCRSLESTTSSSSTTITTKSSTVHRAGTGADTRSIDSTSQSKPKAAHAKPHASFATTTHNSPACLLCKDEHPIGSCPAFCQLSPVDRHRKARVLNLCFNCLKPDHNTSTCQAGSCRKCNRRHHSLLHFEENTRPAAAALISTTHNKQVLLATAVAQLVGPTDNLKIRTLIDNGSQYSYITEACVKRLGLARKKANLPVSGVGMASPGCTRGLVEFNIKSSHNVSATPHFIQAYVLQTITGALPNEAVNKAHITFLPNVPHLADPHFDQPGEIDVLLGSRVLGSLLLDGRLHDNHDKALYAQNTTLGWVIAGPIPGSKALHLRTMLSLTCDTKLDAALQRFWELETLESTKSLTTEEQACEQHFAATHTRNDEGRYIVKLPFRPNAPVLGDSISAALRSLQHLERRFAKNPELHRQYTQFIEEYLSLGHMSLATHELHDSECFYLPHHPVFKPSSTTTKIRVVFDASRKSSSGASLNDALMVGPKLQKDLVEILLRFRTHAVAFCGDVVKMYRQIQTSPACSEHQRILWRSSPDQPIRTYRLDTVTYGTASASYLATKALQQLAVDEQHRFPAASQTTLADFYVDDLMTGCDSVAEALSLQQQLIGLMTAGGFKLSKWASNHNCLLESVPEDQRGVNCPLDIDVDSSIKALGLAWNPGTDCFQYRVALPEAGAVPTKRVVLSEVAQLFDPLGLLAPLIVAAKIFLQALWAEGLAWDQPLPQCMADRWLEYRMSLPDIHAINVPRWLRQHSTHTHQIHGFCDASEAAYAAVVYLRAADPDGNITTRIITARTKVAPVKKISVPRLELCGAVLLARLIDHVKLALKLPDVETHAWCDSTVTVAWIRKPSHTWQTFVANRVSIIQSLTSPEIWHHVPGCDNPADAASRGLTASALVEAELWWHGPAWLQQPITLWPRMMEECSTHFEAKQNIISLHTNDNTNPLLERFSSLSRLLRVTVHLQRFVHNSRHPPGSRKTGSISTSELAEATRHWVRVVQSSAFASEIARCTSGVATPPKSALIALDPFLDEAGILRVGGRIGNAHIPYNARHPMILPKRSHLSDLLVAAAHQRNLHSGPQLTIASLRQEFWIISVRNVVKHHIHRCNVCIRHKHTLGRQFMAPLPERRMQPARAFLSSGVDYAGPITIKLQAGRGTKTSKAYIALFVCFATKALHLELVSSLSADAFLAAFRRFVARRGKCAHLHSDCGTNFSGANKEIRQLHSEVLLQFRESTLIDELASDGTQWHFNPPGAPSFGGIWEAGVKSVKHHLRRTLGTSLLTFEELYTVLVQIEAALNSRPICPLSDDARDLQALTPGHFIIGEPMNTAPDPTVPPTVSPLRRWQHLQRLSQHFWQRWRKEYLATLQQRYKWTKRTANIRVGTLALIADETLPPARWSMGRVTDVHPGADGLVRVVTLQHKSGVIKRPIIKLVIFPHLNDKQHTVDSLN